MDDNARYPLIATYPLASTLDGCGITLLVCGYNSAGRLPATLEALAALTTPTPPFGVELLVIDNASTDETAAVAARELAARRPFFAWQVLHEPRAGKSHALALGFACARYGYVCIVDDDNWLASDYLNQAWEIMEANAQIGALGGVGEPVCEVAPPAWFAEFAPSYAAAPQAPHSGDITRAPGYLYGAGTVVRVAAWQRVRQAGFRSLLTGRYGSSLASGEDNEMCFAFALAGYRIWYDERLRFRHFIPAQRLTWDYVRRLYEGNAASEVDLRPYHHLMWQRDIPVLAWLRNGFYAGRVALRTSWQAARQGRLLPAEGNREGLLAAYYWRVFGHYLRKQLQQDPKFEQVASFIGRLRAVPAAPQPQPLPSDSAS